jgi:esterase/lipase superfamily enzyme
VSNFELLRRAATAAAVCAGMVQAGCSGRPLQGVMIPTSEAAPGATQVPVLIATTRKKSTADPGEMFSGERAEAVSYAAVTISVPPDDARKVGEVQWPASPPGDPRRDFVTVSADYVDERAFNAQINRIAKQTGRNRALIFVHGFNNRFDDAVYRFAQIVHDSKAPAIPVLFTWPSRGEVKLRAYTYDRESANYSRDALEQLIDTLARHPNIREVNILAHSMGNWVTLEALRGRSIRLAQRPGQVDKVKNAFLVAPDVDVDVFRTQIKRMGPNRPRIALFVSQDDKALELSKTIWGGVPRLGEINPGIEPYRTELEKDRIAVFDLTSLKSVGDDAHSRAFEDITTVMGMIKKRLNDGQQIASRPSDGAVPSLEMSTLGQ